MKNSLLFILCTVIILCQTYSQIELGQTRIPINTGARYISGDDGTIRMYVNIWGHVGNPGRILVDEVLANEQKQKMEKLFSKL